MLQPNMVPVELNNNNGDDETNVNNINNNISCGMNLGDEELDSGNTSENPEGGLGNDQDRRPSKRKRYHRHSQHQIQEMESFFKECPHPDDKQRKDLSRQLGLDHLQIKFWFQNKRTQNKNQLERHENTQLRAENDNLRGDNQRYREAIINASCPSCGNHTAIGEMSFEEHHLRLENAKLNEEIHQLSALAATVTGKQVRSYPAMSPPPVPTRAIELGMGSMGREVYANMDKLSIRRISGVNDADKPMIIELALGAMDELIRMAQVGGEPLWKGGADGAPFALNFNEYARTFCNGHGPVPNGFRLEASKETAVVFMNPRDIVERLMNVNQWSTTFAGMVGKAMNHEALLIGINGNYDGAFHLMTAEYKVLSPLVSTRESCFVRYCKHQGDGVWAVVDVSIDQFVPTMELNCRRRPSGCLIQDIGNGCASRVTWVEHVEVDDRGTVHGFFKQYMNSGQALGAKRWVATLNHMAERLALATSNITTLERSDLIQLSSQAKKSVLKLADRMSYGFFSGVTDSNTDVWCTLPGYTSENVKLMTRKSVNDPGVPPGVILCAATSFWVPVPHQVVFDFLRDEKNRVNWDVLTNGAISHKISQIVTGRDTKNCIALYRSVHTNQRKMMMIQEHSTDPTASYVIYAPVDLSAMDRVLKGGDPDFVPAIPSGFAVLPDGMAPPGSEGGGSILNVAFQVLAETNPSAMLTVSSVATVENLILSTVQRIKAYFHFQIE